MADQHKKAVGGSAPTSADQATGPTDELQDQAVPESADAPAMIDRRALDRRRGEDRRKTAGKSPTGVERRSGVDRRTLRDRRSGLMRRRGAGIRRSEDRRMAEEGEMTDEQFEFIQAVNEFRAVNGVSFPSYTDLLAILKYLGYRKTAPVGEIDIDGFPAGAKSTDGEETEESLDE